MIEEIILNYLRESGFPCYLSVPEQPSGNFVVLDKTGSGHDEGLFHATLAVQSYGKSKFSAAQLSHHVVPGHAGCRHPARGGQLQAGH